MVFIHGGGFTTGAGTTDAYGPERLLDYGVVSHSCYKRIEKLTFGPQFHQRFTCSFLYEILAPKITKLKRN